MNNNPEGYAEWWYKPTAGATPTDVAASSGASAMEQEQIKRILQGQKAARV